MENRKVLIVGASSEKSIGQQWADMLKQDSYKVTLASRSGTLGEACDITIEKQVENLVQKNRPDILIHAAGLSLLPSKNLTTARVLDHIKAKIKGVYNCFEALQTYGHGSLIVLGGDRESSYPDMKIYCSVNRVVLEIVLKWQTRRHLDKRIPLVQYLKLPPVVPSTMMEPCLEEEKFSNLASKAISIEESYQKLKKLLAQI